MSEDVNDLVLNEGSLAVKQEGIKASGTVTVTDNNFDGGEVLTINGVNLTEGSEWAEGANADATATSIANAINNSTNRLIKGLMKAEVATNVVTISALDVGTDGNAYTLAESDGATDNLALSGATLENGAFCQGVYQAEEAAEDFIATLEEGLEFSPNRELLERSVRTSTTESEPSRVGIKSASGSIPLEYKAASNEGDLPEYTDLLLACMGGKRRSVNTITLEAGNTATVLNVPAADLAYLNIGDCIKLRANGLLTKDHIAPIVSKDTGAETVTLGFAFKDENDADVVIPDNTEIAPFVTYFVDQAKAPTVSATNYIGGKIREKITGLRVSSMDINNFTTGQIGDLTFGVEGVNYEKEVGAPLFAPSFDTSTPPVMLCAKVLLDDGEILVNTFATNVANTVGFKTATGSKNGRISSRFTDFALTGTIDPYTSDTDVDRYNLFDLNSAFSLFSEVHNPVQGDTSAKAESIATYMPNCRMNEFTTGEQEGLATDAISYSAHKTNGNDTLFITMS